MLRAYKYRLYPTSEQAEFFAKSFGCVRVAYNRTLDYMSMFWIGLERSVSYFDAKRQLVAMKEYFPWLSEVNSQSLQYAIKQCADGFRNWWEHRAEHPVPRTLGSRSTIHSIVLSTGIVGLCPFRSARELRRCCIVRSTER